jgi:flagellar biogenesis protein FliO
MEALALLTVLVVVVLGIWLGRKLGRRNEAARHRAEEERLAQAADAAHEGAKTRHEGGA